MTTYIITHTTKYGITNRMFKSANPDLNISLCKDDIYDEKIQKITAALGIEYNHDGLDEYLDIVDYDIVNDLKTIEV